jgi:Fe-S cluster biogenesis protein NfuA/nitrite reductase/ring-hydroxylating ferredoxin subunit
MDTAILAPAHGIALTDLTGELARLEATVETWTAGPRDTARAWRDAIDALHAEALRRLIRALRGTPEAAAALREAAADEVVYAVLRHHGLVKPGIVERVEAALASIRPLLATHGGDIELVRVEPPAAFVRFAGACTHCPASALTTAAAIRTAVRAACPEITDIVQVRDSGRDRGGDPPRTEDSLWLPAGMVADIPEDGMRAIAPGGRALILARSGSVVMCFDDRCTHLGSALRDGIAEDGILSCPTHGFRYDLRTGDCVTSPGLSLVAHEVRVVGARVLVRIAG